MITKEEIYIQNIKDLCYIICKYSDILLKNGVREEDKSDIHYCTKVLEDVVNKMNFLDKK